MILDFLSHLISQKTEVGSRATCSPAPTDTDQDILVLIKGDMHEFERLLAQNGFTHDGSEEYECDESEFRSCRKGDVNIIFTNDIEFHSKFLAASSVAKRLNLLVKDDRIALFKAVLYSQSCLPEFFQAPIPYPVMQS